MIYETKPGVDLEGVHPFLRYGPAAWIIYAVSMAIMGRRPYVTSAKSDRSSADGADNPRTWHDNGLALDLRGNDRDIETRTRYKRALELALAPFGCFDVIGPYDPPNGHVHVELDARKLAQFGYLAAGIALVWVLLVRG